MKHPPRQSNSTASSPWKRTSQRWIQTQGMTLWFPVISFPLCSDSKTFPKFVPISTYSSEQIILCRCRDFTMQSSPLLDSSFACPENKGSGPTIDARPHLPAACLCSLASLSMLKGSLGASRRSQDGHTEAPGHLFDALVGEGVTAARAACSWSIRDPTPIFKGSLGPPPVRDRKGRGGEIRRLD